MVNTQLLQVAPIEAAKTLEKLQASEEVSFEELVDIYGDLKQYVTAITPDPAIAQLSKIEAKILELAAVQLEQDEEAEIVAERWKATIGACAKESRKLEDLSTFKKIVGDDVFMKLAKINVTDVDKYLTPEQVSNVLSEPAYTTKRRLSVKAIS